MVKDLRIILQKHFQKSTSGGCTYNDGLDNRWVGSYNILYFAKWRNIRFFMFQFMTMTKALSDENRIRILMALHERGELCVCHLIDLLELAPSTVSKHLFLLKNAHLVVVRKDGRWAHYRLNDRKIAPACVTEALAWVARSIAHDPVIEGDRQRLNSLLSVCLHDGCRS